MPEEDEDQTIKVGTLRETAIFDHEMFISWIQAGFTREEAFQLLRDLKRYWQAETKDDE